MTLKTYVTTDSSWQDSSLCREVDPETFFAPDGERPQDKMEREALAIAVCKQCPVTSECLAFAVRTQMADGVWGGLGTEDVEKLWRAEQRQARAMAAKGGSSE